MLESCLGEDGVMHLFALSRAACVLADSGGSMLVVLVGAAIKFRGPPEFLICCSDSITVLPG
jgi:hypothetical protein